MRTRTLLNKFIYSGTNKLSQQAPLNNMFNTAHLRTHLSNNACLTRQIY